MKTVNSNLAYDYLRKKIVSGDYPPDSPLRTEVLSAEMAMSRTPIRDALHKLETDGLVTVQPRVGARVKKMDLSEFREMCDLRQALESHAAGLAALNRDGADLHEIRFSLEEMRRLTVTMNETCDDQAFRGDVMREDVRFHIAIMTASKNKLMKKEILRLHLVNRVLYGPSVAERVPPLRPERVALRQLVLASHEEIYTAIAAADVPAAKRAMDRHIQFILDDNLRAMKEAAPGSEVRALTDEELLYTS